MTYDEKCRLTLRASLQECGRHCDRLERGIELLRPVFPLTSGSLEKLNETQVALLDQYLYRFMKLQDAMGIRVLPSLHTLLYGTFEPVPFLNILASLEKSGVIDGESDWLFFRNIRNSLAHEYPDSKDQTVLSLNILFEKMPRMIAIYRQAATFCKERGLI